MANNISLITKYLPEALDKVFATESKSKILDNGQKWINVNFEKAGYVEIASILMDGLSDYHRVNSGDGAINGTHFNTPRDGFEKGNAQVSWELLKLRYDRGKQFQIDNMDNEETAGITIGNLLTEFIRTKVVPECDELTFATLVSKCKTSLGNLLVNKTIAPNKIIEDFNKAFVWLIDHDVPSEDQVIFVSPEVWGLILNTTELNKFITQGDLKGDITNDVKSYMGREIVVVPTSRFFTNPVLDNGYYATAQSKAINYIICSKKAVVPVKKLEYSKIWTPEQVQDFNGYKVNFRMYHDVIVPKNKIVGVFASVSPIDATTKSNVLELDIENLGSTNHKVNAIYTTPAGVYGSLVYKASAMPVGSKETGATDIELGETFARNGATYFALLDENQKVVATSKQITLADD